MKSLLFFAGIMFLMNACTDKDKEPEVQLPKEEFTQKSLSLIEDGDAFGWNLFRTINQEADAGSNVVVSPISVTQAFGMAINGASGDNRAEMLSVMGFDNSDGMNEAYQNIRGALQTADPKVKLGIANSAWYHKEIAIKSPFFDALKTYYDAEIAALDFSNKQASIKAINDWVNGKTRGKIPSIIDNISANHFLFLINAVYFNGEWASRFDKGKTSDQPFRLSDGHEVNVKMMYQKENFAILYGEGFSGVRLPYGNDAFAMNLLLPDDGKTADDIINSLNTETWKALRNQQHARELEIYLPRFKTECEYNLIPALRSLGMNIAFAPGSGFSNITDGPIHISDVVHKTFIEVDERGTEAAAVTSIGFELTSVGPTPPVFRFDKPFVFVISEKESGAVLFAGKIENPLN